MDSNSREQLRERLGKYILDTLEYIQIIKKLCDQEEEWCEERETECKTIKEMSSKEYSKNEKLEKKLEEVLMGTVDGIKKLQPFLDLIEMLAVTSLFVFMDESFMPIGVSAASVRSVISNARRFSPLLIHFKRDAEAFFLPSLSNVDVLAFQLEQYINITKQICEKIRSMGALGSGNIFNELLWKNGQFSSLSEESVQKMSDHLTQLNKIRMDESFRLTFLFNDKAQCFIDLFNQRSSRLFQFLSDLEEAAVQLDRMKMGSDISSVAGSSVGLIGGVLSIVGLALAPVTAGVSLVLTMTGVGLGVTSGVNSLVTVITGAAVKHHHGKNANNIFIKFMEDVNELLTYIGEVASTERLVKDPSVGDIINKTGNAIGNLAGISKGIDFLVDGVSAVKVLGSEEVIVRAANLGLAEVNAARNIPNLAADLSDIGQVAKSTPLALSKSARAGFITLNALFIGFDVAVICKDSISLAKGSKSEVAQLIRARSVLWRSEVEALQKISNHLSEGIQKFDESQEILERPFYP